MGMASGIHFGRIPANAVHLCVDMQRLFAEDTAWRTPWMPRVLPVVVRLCERKAERTCFTRFIPARSPGEGRGTWRRYWERWSSITLDNLGDDKVELLPELQTFTPPARVLDKAHYSAWVDTGLASALAAGHVDTLVVTGSAKAVRSSARVIKGEHRRLVRPSVAFPTVAHGPAAPGSAGPRRDRKA